MQIEARDERGLATTLIRLRDTVRRAFHEFLGVPACTVTAFVVLAAIVGGLDSSSPGWLAPIRRLLSHTLFEDASATREVLSVVAAGIITMTSITVSVLLLAVQQTASMMTNAVLDQFLRRRINQFFFGFFIGLALFALTTMAMVHEGAVPVLGAALALLLTVVALLMLVVLLYASVDQMRPEVIGDSVRRMVLAARDRQTALLQRTRRAPSAGGSRRLAVTAQASGHVTHIDIECIGRAVGAAGAGGFEIVLRVAMGTYVAYGDTIADVCAGDALRIADPGALARGIRAAIRLEPLRDLGNDPAFGIEQLQLIGWTAVSSAKSNPGPGFIAIRAVRDLLARWVGAGDPEPDVTAAGVPADAPPVLPVVYRDDTVEQAFRVLESLGVAADESHQHQSLAEVLRALAALLPRVRGVYRDRAAAVVGRVLPTVEKHVMTAELHAALADIVDALTRAGEIPLAEAVRRTAECQRPAGDAVRAVGSVVEKRRQPE